MQRQREEDALYAGGEPAGAGATGAATAAAATGAAATAGAAASPADDDDFVPLTEEQMEAELDLMDEADAADEADGERAGDERDESAGEDADDADEDDEYYYDDDDDDAGLANRADAPPPAAAPDAVSAKLDRVARLREEMRLDEARKLLYEVLVDGDDTQVLVARNILDQLDN
jgi:sec-independent protein translocase protein TatC